MDKSNRCSQCKYNPEKQGDGQESIVGIIISIILHLLIVIAGVAFFLNPTIAFAH